MKTKHPASAQLLRLLSNRANDTTINLCQWEAVVRTARHARLLGTLAHHLHRQPERWQKLPAPVCQHLHSAMRFCAYRHQMLRVTINDIAQHLPSDISVILLKGGAYLQQGFEFADGRLANDIDILVNPAELLHVETQLQQHGWRSTVHSSYDEYYYRHLSHELPPLQHRDALFELDVHHTITPRLVKDSTRSTALFACQRQLSHTRFNVLDGRDQIIHAALHLFRDTELDNRLRDLVDLDQLFRHFAADALTGQWLLHRARYFQAEAEVWLAMYYCHHWLATPLPYTSPTPPSRLRRLWLSWSIPITLPPPLLSRANRFEMLVACYGAKIHYHLLRMPLHQLLMHMGHKLIGLRLPHRTAKKRQ